MKQTKIRWAGYSWNFFTGCDRVSEGCGDSLAGEPRPPGSGCYAEALAERMRGTPAFPVGFDPQYRPHKLNDPAKIKEPARIFVNSMSDLFHRGFTDEQRDAGFDVMLRVSRHAYLILTKRPERMAHYIEGWLRRQGLDAVPPHIWLGTSIELAKYNYRADVLRTIPCPIRFLSIEPLLGPVLNACNCGHHLVRHGSAGCFDCAERCDWDQLPGLNLDGISWVIVGGESGPGFRPMDLTWARDVQEKCEREKVAFFYKQGAAIRTEMNIELDGRRYEEYPADPPGDGPPAQVALL